MTRRFSSISTQTTLATSISNSALSLVVATGTASTLLGGVALTAGNVDQFKIIIDPDTASSEICYVTEVTSDTLTIQRGKDGTSAVSHTGGAVIKHVLTGEDLTYFTTGVVPTSNLAVGLPFPGSTSGTATVKAPAVAGTTVQTLPGTTGTLISAESTAAATTKATPVDADVIPLSDSAASGVLKSLSWTNIKATLKTYFDTLYARFNGPAVNTQTASYVLVASDVGKRVVMNSASATTITVNTSLFGAGDTLEILNIGAGVCTITAGTATVSTAGTLALVQNAGGKLYFTSAGVSTFIPSGVAATATTFHGCSVYKSALQTITGNTDTILSFNSENYDTDAYHDTVTNNSRMTIPSSYGGKYLVTVTARASAVSNQFRIILYKNGSAIALGTTSGEILWSGTNSGTNEGFSASFQLALVATDYLEVVVNVGASNIDVASAVYSIAYLGA